MIILIVIIILNLNNYNSNNYHRDHNSRPPHRQTAPPQQQDEELCDHRSRKVTYPDPDKTTFFHCFCHCCQHCFNCHSYMTNVVVLFLDLQIVPVESSHYRCVRFVFVFRLCLCHWGRYWFWKPKSQPNLQMCQIFFRQQSDP